MVKLSANFNGVMDRDSDDRYIEQGSYRTLKNGIIDRDADGGRFLVKNLRSSKFVADVPASGKLVGAKEYKGFLYQFYYDSNTNELSMYRVNPYAIDDSQIVFQRELRDVFTEDIPGDPGSATPSGQNFYNNFLLADVSGTSHLYVYNKLQVNGDIIVDSSVTAGSAFTSEADFNTYFRIANQGTVNEYVICNVPIVCKGEVEGPNENTITISDFTTFADFQQYVTVKNKGTAGEYVVITLPLLTEGVITGFTTEAFSAAFNFTFEDVVEEPTDPTTIVVREHIYDAVDEINYIDFIENQVSGDLLCYWTDGINHPFKINVTKLIEDSTFSYFYIRDMFVAKVVPPEPSIIPYHDYSYTGVDAQNNVFQFATRYVYQDGEKTPLSTYSKAAFYPKIAGVNETVGGINGYYVDGGSLYQISGFDTGSALLINSALEPNHNRAYAASENVILVYSDQYNLRADVQVSFNGGASFEGSSGLENRAITSVCSSGDGQYVFMLTDDDGGDSVYKSDNYGHTFTQMGSVSNDIWGEIYCSDDGNRLMAMSKASGSIVDDVPEDSGNYRYGYTVRIIDVASDSVIFSFSQSMTTTGGAQYSDDVRKIYMNGALSPNGIYAVGITTNENTPSNNYIQVYNIDSGERFVSTSLSEVVQSVILNNDGIGWADNYKTSTFFDQVTTFDDMENVWRLENGFIGEVGGTYTRYNEFGDAESSSVLSFIPSYTKGVSVSYTINNIVNFYNAVDVWVKKPNYYVESVEVFAINTSDGTAYLIKEIENNITNFPVSEAGKYITFRNNIIYRVLSETEKSVLFSNVPLNAHGQAFIGNRLFYANYRDGRDLPALEMDVTVQSNAIATTSMTATIQSDATQVELTSIDSLDVSSGDALILSFAYNDDDGDVRTRQFQHVFTNGYSPDDWSEISVELSSTFKTLFPSGSVTATHDNVNGLYSILFATGDVNITFENIYRSVLQDGLITFRKGLSQQLGIVYYDEYNRGSYPVFGDLNAVIPGNINEPKLSIVVSISHMPPEWATKYKFVRTDRNLQYTIMPGFRYAKAQNGYIYLMKQEGEMFLPDVGMFLDVHDNNGDLHSFQVVSRENKEAGFVVGSPVGEWISIKDPQIDGFSASDVIGGSSLYITSIFYARQSLESVDEILYYEIPGVFAIKNGYHTGNIQSQTEALPYAQIRLTDAGNVAYIPDVGVEVYETSGGGTFWNGGRALLDVDNAGEIHRYSSITWSDAFVQDTGYNGLSMFNQGILNWKSLDIAKGHINAVLPLDTNLYIWQEDQVGYVLVNKNAITTALGEQAITSANQVAGQFVPYGGEYGTFHPRSVTHYGTVRYFVDTKRDAVCRISQDGITEISMQNMASEFHRILDENDTYIAAFNVDHKELWIYSANENIVYVFDEKAKGWTRYFTPGIINAMLADDKNIYTINDTVVYSQMDGTDYGNINGQQVDFEFEYIQNAEPGMVKVWNTSEIEANKPIKTIISIGGSYNSGEDFDSAVIDAKAYETREGEYFAYIPGALNVDISSFNGGAIEGGVIVPMGVVRDVGLGSIELMSNITEPIGEINHSIFIADADGSAIYRGALQDINSRTINSDENFDQGDIGKLAFLVENSYLNGHKIRSPFVRVKFVDNGLEKVAIFASRLEVIESKNQ